MNKYTSLEYLLSGIDLNQFLNEFYGKKYLHINRKDNSFYEMVFNIDKFDNLINNNIFTTKYFKISKLGSNPDKGSYSVYDSFNREAQISIGKVLNLFSEGHTIVLDDVARNDREILDIEIDIANTLKYVDYISTNAYLTPTESQAFPMHYDIQDVFILQIFGSKKWQIFPDVDNQHPIDFSYENIIDDIKKQSLEGTTITLKAGDLLYIPRGMVHEVNTNDECSLHLTISVVNFTIFNFLEKSLNILKNNNLYFRNNLNNLTDIQDYKENIISFIKGFDHQKILTDLEHKNKYKSLYNFKNTLLYNINPLDLNNVLFEFKKDVKISIEKEETFFEYGYKKTSIEGDFSFLKLMGQFDISKINNHLNNSELSEELIYYLIFEGFISKIKQ